MTILMFAHVKNVHLAARLARASRERRGLSRERRGPALVQDLLRSRPAAGPMIPRLHAILAFTLSAHFAPVGTVPATPDVDSPDGSDANAARIEAAWLSRSTLPPPPRLPPEPPRRAGMLASGLVLTVVGLPLTILGARVVARGFSIDGPGHRSSFGAIGALFVLPGVSLLAAGIPLTVLGGIGFARWRRWQARYGLAVQPMIGRSASGAWLPGLALRF